jgi:transgelin
MAGLRNDSSETASKISQASMASAEAAYTGIASWIGKVTGATSLKSGPLEDSLKSGEVLCELMNKIKAGAIPKYHKAPRLAFRQMENIGLFLNACRQYGVSDSNLFITVDLFEAANMKQVIACLSALKSRAEANGFKG